MCGIFLFSEQGAGIVLGALVAFFDDHVTFGGDVGLRELDVDHTIRLHSHDQWQTVCGDALVIGGIIIAGKRVVCATILGHGF